MVGGAEAVTLRRHTGPRRKSRSVERADRDTHSRSPGLTRARARDHPDLQRGGEHRHASSAGCAAPCPPRDVLVADDNSPDGTGLMADALAARDSSVHVLHRLGKEGLGRGVPRRVPVGPRARLRRRSSRWTPTARTSPSSCPSCWLRSAKNARTPTSCSARAGCAAAGSSTGPSRARCCPAAATSGPAGPRRPAQGRHRRLPRLRPADPARHRAGRRRVGRLLLPGRPRLAGGQGGLPGRRGADHLRRAGVRRLEDEPAHRGRGAAAHHGVGRQAPGPAGAGLVGRRQLAPEAPS